MSEFKNRPSTHWPSLSRRLTVGLLLFIGVVELVLMVAVYQDKRVQVRARHEAQVAELQRLIQTLSVPMFHLDFDQVERVGRVLERSPLVRGVLILDELGESRHQAPDEPLPGDPDLGSDVLYQGNPVGAVRLWLHPLHEEKGWAPTRNALLLSLAAALGGTLFGAGVLLRRLLRTPLQELEASMRSLEEDRPESEEMLPRYREFQPIAARFGEMTQAVRNRQEELRELNQALEEEVRERKRIAEQIACINTDLESRVKARTLELERAYERLQQETREKEEAQVRLIESDRMAAMGILAGGVAHEFNNIHAVVLGYTDILSFDPALSEDAKSHLAKITEASIRAKELTRSMLSFAAPGAEHKACEDLCEVVKRSLGLVEREFETAGILLEESLTSLPPVLMNRSQIGQVVFNLLINARHALLGVERPTIGLDADFDEREVRLAIRDNGCGIPEDQLDQVFTPFFSTKGEHADGETPQSHVKGTGLGLSLCHSLVKHHGGRIEVASTAGKGSTFTVYLPRHQGNEPGMVRDTSANREIGDFCGEDRRVLVVDDEADILDMVRIILSRAGYKTVCTDDGEEALQHLQNEPFDLILTDLQMPKMQGAELIQRVEGLPTSPPLLILTGRLEQTEEVEEICRPYPRLTKPFDPEELLEAIELLLSPDGPVDPIASKERSDATG